MRKKVLLLEFNEICPSLIENWLAEGKLANFRKLRDKSDVFISTADETNPVNLEPWIQWYSIHTGRPYSEHQVFHLTDGPKAKHMDIWHFLQDAGLSVMNCGSMNAAAIAGDRAFFLPDPWCDAETAFPSELSIFSKVVSKSVQEYSNAGLPLTKRDLVRFVNFLLRHGLSFRTSRAIASQLFAEKVSRLDQKWRRVALLDRLQFDLFAHYWRRMRPDFATFFSNSTAHLQHAFWRHMDPSAFSIMPDAKDLVAYGDAVYFGYAAMDRLIGEVLEMVGEDTTVILCSGLSQQPYLKWEAKGGQHFYRLRNAAEFLDAMNISPVRIEPVMTHQYLVRFSDQAEAEIAGTRLRAISIDGKPLFGVVKASSTAFAFGCEIFTSLHGKEVLSGINATNNTIHFESVLYPIHSVKSGCHHPDGIFWVGAGRFALHSENVSILDIAPTICDLLEQDLVALRKQGYQGASLADRITSAEFQHAA